MALSDYLRIVRRSWRLVVAVLLATVVVAAVLTALAPREYRAEAQLFVSTGGGNSVTDLVPGGSFTQRQVATYADLVTAPVVLDPVVAELTLEGTAGDLARRVTATVPPDTVLIDIAVVDRDPALAARIADTVATQFTETVQELERVDPEGDSAVKATVVRPATAPQDPDSPDPLRNLALATVLGLLLGLGLAVLRDLTDTRIRGEADVSRVTDEPVIGAVAFDKDDVHSHCLAGSRVIRDVDAGGMHVVMRVAQGSEGKALWRLDRAQPRTIHDHRGLISCFTDRVHDSQRRHNRQRTSLQCTHHT